MHDTVKSYVTNKYPNIRAIFILNKKYLETNTAYSLMLAKQVMLGSEFIKFDADVVFDKKILQNILRTKSPNCICIDKSVHMNNEEIKVICNTSGTVSKIGKSLEPEKALGESIGIEKISSTTAYILFQELETMMEDINNHQKYYESAYERIISKGMIFNIINITGLNWVEIDTLKDLKNAQLIFRDPQA
jgi:choline kinase